MGEIMSLIKTKHASLRLRQRGFKNKTVELIEKYGIEVYKFDNVVKIYIPRKEIAERIRDLKNEINCFEKCKNKALLIAQNENVLITAYHLY